MRLSFVIPTFNTATWLPHCIKSCLAQTYKNVEVVCVDDASTDSTGDYLAWLEKQGDKRIRILRNEKNMGRSFSRNRGNAEASGDAIMVLDADDLATPKRAELTLAKLKNGAKFVYGAAVVIDILGRPMSEVKADTFNLSKAIERKQNRIVHSTVAYTKEIAEKYPYAEGDFARLGIDDWEQQLRIAQDHPLDYIVPTLAAYRVLNAGISSTRDEAEVLKVKDAYLERLKVAA